MRLAGNLHAELLLGLALRAAGAVASFALVWIIARGFGAATLGLFQVAFATAALGAAVVTQGLDRIIVRVASVALSQGRLADAAVAYRKASRRLLVLGVGLAVVQLAGAEPFARYVLEEPEAAPFLMLFAPAAFAVAQIRLCSSLLRSNGRILLSQSLDAIAYNAIAAAVVGIATLIGLFQWQLLPAAAYVVSTIAVLVLAIWQCRAMIRNWGTSSAVLPVTAGLYIAAFNGLSTAGDWTGLMLLTNADGAASAGIYRVAFQVTMLFTVVNASFAVMVGPRIAAAGAQGDHLAVRRTVRSAGLLGFFICLPLFVLIVGWAEPILRLFGEDFVGGALALRILAVGQLINVGFGPVGASLTMMHQERKVLLIELFAFVLGIVTIVFLLDTVGMAAVATGAAVASVVRNSASYVAMRRHLGRFGEETESAGA